MERLLCCCVSASGQQEQVFQSTHPKIGMTGEILNSQAGTEAALPLASSTPHFPNGRARDDPSQAQEQGNPASSRSNASMGSSMSPEEKEGEKARLQKLVKDFAKEAVTGIAVTLINAETGRKSPHFFQMDRYLTVFSLKPKDGSTAESSVQDFNMKDLASIYKGADVSFKAPSLGSAAACCVGLDTNRADRRLFFHFEDHYERDKFYTCLKILRMSVDITRPGA